MSQEIVDAVRALAREKGISEEKLITALEDALLSAYKKQPDAVRYARVHLDPDLGEYRVEELILPEVRERYGLEVSSPGPERPLSKPDHFRRYVGRRARVRTRGRKDGHTSFTGELLVAGDDGVTVAADTGVVSIAYADIQRSNLVGD